jgi:predicted phosphodiesterase
MAIQILSDLHLEAPKAYDVFQIVPKAPYLALLGDMGNIASHRDDCLAFLTLQLNQFRAVLFVPGNHEAYHSNWPRTLDILRAFEQDVRKDRSLGEFVLLDRAAFRLPGTNVTILGCSLFSSIPPESQMAVSFGLNDFFQTSDWDVGMHNEAHKRDLAWLNAQVADLEQSDVNIMIFSHWSPSLDVRAVEPRHAGSPITSAFSTELSDEACFKSGNVKVWAFGHTHYNCDFTVEREGGAGRLRLLANQRGYYFAQAEGYDGEKTVEV